MSPHLITAQLICPGAICCRDAGALMWRCVDFELERSAGVWSEWLGVFSTEQFPNRRPLDMIAVVQRIARLGPAPTQRSDRELS